jgi:hypothetical protein
MMLSPTGSPYVAKTMGIVVVASCGISRCIVGRNNRINLKANQFVGDFGESFVSALCGTVFNDDRLSFNVTSLTESAQEGPAWLRPVNIDPTDPGDFLLLLRLCGLHERQQDSHYEEQNFFSHWSSQWFSTLQPQVSVLYFSLAKAQTKCPTEGEPAGPNT